ncbi:MAG TPA: helix-turn-helix transcriptional regulator [Mucilaginibacter sp.]|jgi:DNA-binding CsgD family transcriptional regulator
MATNEISWINYKKHLQAQSSASSEPMLLIPDGLLNIGSLAQPLFSHCIPWIYLLDYTTGKYMITSNGVKNLIGYDIDRFLNNTIDTVLDIYDKDHLRLLDKEIFPDRFRLLNTIPANEHPNYIFNYNFKLRNKRGEYVNLLQRNCFIKSDVNGNPLLSYGIITNIEHYKNENPVIDVIEKINDTGGFGGTAVISKKHYYLNGEDRFFTKREKELLLWLIDGLSSKQIADKLFISEYTVINHKRNMMMKCNANNTAELVGFAIKNQLY